MRIYEIASAEQQLALWKLISDNVWRALTQQSSEQRKRTAASAAQRKLKPKRRVKRGGRKSPLPPPLNLPPPPQAAAPTPTQNLQKNSGGTAPQAMIASDPQIRNPSPAPSATQPLKPQSPLQQRLQRQNAVEIAKIAARADSKSVGR